MRFANCLGWLLVVAALLSGCGKNGGASFLGLEIREVVEYRTPDPPKDPPLADDQLSDKHPMFDPALVDRRPLGEWLVNQSEAVIRLDVPTLLPDADATLLKLNRSYADAARSVRGQYGHPEVLPSVNMIDGKAKQFDDGLYAALDLAWYQGVKDHWTGHVELVKRMLDKVGPKSPAAPFLAAGLRLAGAPADVADHAKRDAYVADFERRPELSKPISFYTWNDELRACWKFLRFFQKKFDAQNPVVAAIRQALKDDPTLQDEYRRAVEFFARLTNPYRSLSYIDVLDLEPLHNESARARAQERGVKDPQVALYPSSDSKEATLFDRLFPLGVPPDADLMKELVRRIKSGEVDLRPGPESGWYDHQVYALETLLLSEKGEEREKLLLTRQYKERMLEAFKALMTKRRETHARSLGAAGPASAAPQFEKPDTVSPRLRVEPCPTFYLRTARAYSFLLNFLAATCGQEALEQLHGWRADGQRPDDLHTELLQMRKLFYGLYLMSAEDIGLKPSLSLDELDDPDACYEWAEKWLATAWDDPDLAQDTRVAVPIYVDPIHGRSRIWATIGVRLAKLHTRFATPPRIKPREGESEWELVEHHRLMPQTYLIPVDEFVEVELPTVSPPDRAEFRRVCDTAGTKESIVTTLRGR